MEWLEHVCQREEGSEVRRTDEMSRTGKMEETKTQME